MFHTDCGASWLWLLRLINTLTYLLTYLRWFTRKERKKIRELLGLEPISMVINKGRLMRWCGNIECNLGDADWVMRCMTMEVDDTSRGRLGRLMSRTIRNVSTFPIRNNFKSQTRKRSRRRWNLTTRNRIAHNLTKWPWTFEKWPWPWPVTLTCEFVRDFSPVYMYVLPSRMHIPAMVFKLPCSHTHTPLPNASYMHVFMTVKGKGKGSGFI